MYVLKNDAKAYDTGQMIPKGTALFSIYSEAGTEDGVLAMARLAGERHKLAIKKDDMEWASEPRVGT